MSSNPPNPPTPPVPVDQPASEPADLSAGDSRLTNGTNSVNASTGGIQESDESGADDGRGIPTPAERAAEFVDEYPDRAMLPVTGEHETTLRREFAHVEYDEWEANDRSASGVDERYQPMTWGAAVETLLENHEETRRTTVNLEKGRPGTSEHETYSVDADNRFMAEYQQKYFAQLKGGLREFVGGERPSGGEATAKFDDPYLVLLTRSASAAPGGRRLPPVDHVNALKESWEPVYHTLRNTMRALGFSMGEDWVYDRRWEPHKGERGGGVNHAYPHEHVVLVLDGKVTASAFAKVMEKHAESCEPAGMKAHQNSPCAEHADPVLDDWNAAEPTCDDCDTAVNVKKADSMNNIAAYVADYTGIQPKDLLERSTEYIGFAAAVSAANARTITRSDAMNNAATADRCKQRYESDESKQSHDHGETVVPSDRRGADFECIECGSPHGIDQSPDTLTEARVERPTVADGGLDREEKLRDRWGEATVELPDGTTRETSGARAAVAWGEGLDEAEMRDRIKDYLQEDPEATPTQVCGALMLPPGAEEIVREVRAGIDPNEPVSFASGPEWSVKSVTVGQEEYPASAGNGVELVSMDLPEKGIRERLNLEEGLVTCECGVTVGADSVVSHLLTHGTDPEILAGLIT